jgi:hypothetical protein
MAAMTGKPRPNHGTYLRVLRAMTPEQRLRKAFALGATARAMFEQGLRRRFPELGRRGARPPRARAPRPVSQPELLKLVARRLEAAGIEYMITGSVASSLQGEPRATHDIDVVVAVRTLAADVAAGLKAAFPQPDFYLDEAAVRDAIAARGLFNLIDAREGDRVDFWLLTDDAFDRARFERRYVERFEDARLPAPD